MQLRLPRSHKSGVVQCQQVRPVWRSPQLEPTTAALSVGLYIPRYSKNYTTSIDHLSITLNSVNGHPRRYGGLDTEPPPFLHGCTVLGLLLGKPPGQRNLMLARTIADHWLRSPEVVETIMGPLAEIA